MSTLYRVGSPSRESEADSLIQQKIAEAQQKISDQQKAAEDQVQYQASQLDAMLNGFLTGAVPAAQGTSTAGVLIRDATGVTSASGVTEEKSILPLILIAGLGYYFFIHKKGRI